jgi:hypothetical protein
VERTIINGKVVWEDGRLTGVDEDAVKEKAKKKVAEVYKDIA